MTPVRYLKEKTLCPLNISLKPCVPVCECVCLYGIYNWLQDMDVGGVDGVRQRKSMESVITIVACIGVLVYCIMSRSCRMSRHFLTDHHYLNWIREDRAVWMNFSNISCIHHALTRIKYSFTL